MWHKVSVCVSVYVCKTVYPHPNLCKQSSSSQNSAHLLSRLASIPGERERERERQPAEDTHTHTHTAEEEFERDNGGKTASGYSLLESVIKVLFEL